jgi:2-polyprenyl-6-hydroxyphenyl methylase / 3-demethylubiquinone-9 3-methyltransferase
MEKKSNYQSIINNDFYDFLKEDWYNAYNHPVALLRFENETRLPWVVETIKNRVGHYAKILDVGCGAGLLANPLACHGFEVTGIDVSKESLL